jgi:hemolysin activation/secretion protein
VFTAPTGTSTRVGADNIQVGRIGADYNLQDVLAGDTRPALNTASVKLSHGLPFLGGTQSGAADATRVNEDTGFTKVVGQLERTQTLFTPWHDASLALKLLLTGQGSGDILPPVEKFYLGGSQFTRGYYAGEATGDSALAATAELELNTPYEAVAFGHPVSLRAQWYLFYDWGAAWQNSSLDQNFHLSSEGIGLRLAITRYTEFDLEGDIRNTRLPEGTPGAVKPIPSEAAFWGFLARF